ncbi:MAG: RIP metalloprotease RseP [Tenericutes bacterium HGW-Tenericutes-1]|jgi:regulator of sigma E protease|nr:MAG: RIP metalloprotease RseP [Tenericutes bacterium HGW-Tenericutes-1]
MGILSVLGNILLFVLVLSIVICIHELGHFYFAKKAGILCHEFSFGMGPRIWSKKKGETTFSIRAFPFGGFVSMSGEEINKEMVSVGDTVKLMFDELGHVKRIILKPKANAYADIENTVVEKIDLWGENMSPLYINDYPVRRDAFYMIDGVDMQIAPQERNFNSKNKRQRFMVTVAGAMMNIILAFFVFLVIAMGWGVADPESTVISDVTLDTPAYGILLPGDEIISINDVEVFSWSEDNNLPSVNSELAKYDSEYIFFTVIRDGEPLVLPGMKKQFLFYSLGFASSIGTEELVIGTPLYKTTELQTGDKIVSIDGITFTNWQDLIDFSITYQGSTEEEPTTIIVDRDGELLTFNYIAYNEETLSAMGQTAFYARVGITGSTKFSFFGSFKSAMISLYNSSISIYATLGLLFTSDQVGVGDLSGFIGIYSITSEAAKDGLRSLLSWVGLLSVNLGIVNLLPIPALDGGRLAFIAYEAITKRKPNQKLENLLHTIVLFLLLGLMVFITYKDILRLF